MLMLLALATIDAAPVTPPPPPVVATVAAPAPLTQPITVGAVTVQVALPGRYDCTGDDNVTVACVRDDAQPELPANPAGDQPGQTLGSTDAAYGADLTDQFCAVKPWICQP